LVATAQCAHGCGKRNYACTLIEKPLSFILINSST
jgi:hypothetical protein